MSQWNSNASNRRRHFWNAWWKLIRSLKMHLNAKCKWVLFLSCSSFTNGYIKRTTFRTTKLQCFACLQPIWVQDKQNERAGHTHSRPQKRVCVFLSSKDFKVSNAHWPLFSSQASAAPGSRLPLVWNVCVVLCAGRSSPLSSQHKQAYISCQVAEEAPQDHFWESFNTKGFHTIPSRF